MRKDTWRLITAICLLLLFMGSKGMELHSLSHSPDGDQVSCEWCEHALVIHNTPFEPAEVISLNVASFISFHDQIVSSHPIPSEGAKTWEPLFGRPPPVI